MFYISVCTSNVVKIHMVKMLSRVFKRFREQLVIPGVDSPIGHSGRCPSDWLPGQKKMFGIVLVNPEKSKPVSLWSDLVKLYGQTEMLNQSTLDWQ